jgi:hypothetical protein
MLFGENIRIFHLFILQVLCVLIKKKRKQKQTSIDYLFIFYILFYKKKLFLMRKISV